MTFISNRNLKARANWDNQEIQKAAKAWHDFSRTIDYQYMFEFCGLPIIQDPQDICFLQELIWKVKPTVVIETGVAHGGSLVLSAVILAALYHGQVLNGLTPELRKVIGIDISIREENRENIKNHPLGEMIYLIEGSSTDKDVVGQIDKMISSEDKVLVILDSNHEEDHVLNELSLYSGLVSVGSAICVMDTGIEFAPPETFNVVRPWKPGSNPYTATKKFLNSEKGINFRIERQFQERMLISCAPDGLLMRI